MSDLTPVNYDKLLGELRELLKNSYLPARVSGPIARAVDALDDLLLERTVRERLATLPGPVVVAGNPTLDVLHEISGKLDTLIDLGKYR